MRLIDADRAIEIIEQNYIIHNAETVTEWTRNVGVMQALNTIVQAPTIDAVPVLRCRECRHYIEGQCYHPNHDHHEKSVCVEDNHFCGWGQRREDGDV